MSEPINISKSQVKLAGSTIRKFMRGENVSRERMHKAVAVIDAYRAAHQYPLTKANMGLRSMLKTERCEVVGVSQRLKRFMTIVDKLGREPTLALDRMQDIGGCRAIIGTVAEIRGVEARIKKRRPPIGYSDYIQHPRDSGYRGVHLVVQYDGRAIEIQLRTRVMHAWAITVERQSARLGEHLKGDGSHVVQLLMATISEALAIEEQGGVVPSSLQDEIQRRRLEAAPYLEGTS